jgi:hypothetical protein
MVKIDKSLKRPAPKKDLLNYIKQREDTIKLCESSSSNNQKITNIQSNKTMIKIFNDRCINSSKETAAKRTVRYTEDRLTRYKFKGKDKYI